MFNAVSIVVSLDKILLKTVLTLSPDGPSKRVVVLKEFVTTVDGTETLDSVGFTFIPTLICCVTLEPSFA